MVDCKTLEDALRAGLRYYHIMLDGFVARLHVDGGSRPSCWSTASAGTSGTVDVSSGLTATHAYALDHLAAALQRARHDLLHDLVGASVDLAHARVHVHAGDRVVGHVTVAAVQL
jgi:hypothetical protein